MLFQQAHEISVLAHQDDTGFASTLKDFEVCRIPQSERPNRRGLKIREASVDPGGNGGRELCVDPDLHAAITG